MSEQLQITDGPSKWELMIALFERSTRNIHKVSFQLDNTTYWRATVSGVSIEDGSGESWLITGYAQLGHPANRDPVRYEAHFRTDRRKGWIKFQD